MTTPIIIHLHVPKCAGSSVNKALATHFRPRCIGLTKDTARRKSFLAMQRKERDEKFDCAFGHLRFGEHHLFTRPCRYVSTMREPLERICSFFNFLHTRPDHPAHSHIKATLPDLNEIGDRHADDEKFVRIWRNSYLRVYGGGRVTRAGEEAAVQRILHDVDTGRMLLGPLDSIKAFLSEIGIHQIDRLNATDTSRAEDFSPASVADLTPRAREFIEEKFCRRDYELYDTLEHRGWPDGRQFARRAGLATAWV